MRLHESHLSHESMAAPDFARAGFAQFRTFASVAAAPSSSSESCPLKRYACARRPRSRLRCKSCTTPACVGKSRKDIVLSSDGLSFGGRLRIDPLAVFADQIDETFDGFRFGDVEFDRRLADIQVDLAGRA